MLVNFSYNAWSKEYERCEKLAEYIINTGCTVRQAASRFNVSKSTVHKDVTERLKEVNGEYYTQVCEILKKNKAERHLRGGMATQRKYNLMKNDETK